MATQPSTSNATTPASTSTTTSTVLPPPPPRVTTSTTTTVNRNTSRATNQGVMGTGRSGEIPLMVSNDELLTMFAKVQQYMEQQQKVNQDMFGEVAKLRSEMNRVDHTPVSPVQARRLQYGSPGNGSSLADDIQIIDPRPTYAAAHTTLSDRPRMSTFRDSVSNPGGTTTQDTGNILGTPNLNAHTNESVQDTGLSPAVAKELKKLKEMISSVPGVVQPIPEVAPSSHRLSRFTSPICDVEILKRFQTPSMKLYDGTTDPEEHVAQYMERMEVIYMPPDIKEACLCKGFGSTLTGSALKWLLSIPPYSIPSFSHLINLFNNQFSCSRSFEKLTSDLYRVTQNANESIRDYVNRFGKETLDIPNMDMATAVQAFKMGLEKDSPFYQDLVMNPCHRLDEVRHRALRFIRLEEDRKIQEKADVVPGYGSSNRKSEPAHPRSQRPKPYSKPDNPRVNRVDQGEDEDDEEYPTFNEFCFATDIAGVINAMQDLGDKARWPRKTDKQASWKDKSKWCAYHEDFGHVTEDCIAMRKEISYLLSKGFLKELLGRKKDKSKGVDQSAKSRGTDQTQDADRSRGHPERATSPSPDAKVIYFISGGSDICGTSYSAAKRHARETKSDVPRKSVKASVQTDVKDVTFGEDDRCNVMDPHHDGLVITLYIANHFVKRILIDGGSSVNIIQLETLTKMGIPQDEVIAKSTVLVGFSGETKNTLGEVKLPVYVEGVNSMQRFCVMDAPSGYNIILGRPWIHDMKVVPSTYHQCVKLPTPWGVVTIHSDQQEAKDCYTSAMKISAKARQG
ncbi:hypothetical protein SSX86_016390 [Deinandra increscens subsp. villosa]|uniref:Retrotransposon gag domain-containing protein n=1 Tax=Deinandra increscens subsp. villosa TaxID=3103831 RepID=A0AAP0GYC2_9ASTR